MFLRNILVLTSISTPLEYYYTLLSALWNRSVSKERNPEKSMRVFCEGVGQSADGTALGGTENTATNVMKNTNDFLWFVIVTEALETKRCLDETLQQAVTAGKVYSRSISLCFVRKLGFRDDSNYVAGNRKRLSYPKGWIVRQETRGTRGVKLWGSSVVHVKERLCFCPRLKMLLNTVVL